MEKMLVIIISSFIDNVFYWLIDCLVLPAFSPFQNFSASNHAFLGPSPIAQLLALQTWEQDFPGSIPGSANILFED